MNGSTSGLKARAECGNAARSDPCGGRLARAVPTATLAPRGRVGWAVDDAMKEKLVRERALVEAGIGTLKSRRYGFNRPRARSADMMGACGQLAVLGFNLNKLVRGLAARNEMETVG